MTWFGPKPCNCGCEETSSSSGSISGPSFTDPCDENDTTSSYYIAVTLQYDDDELLIPWGSGTCCTRERQRNRAASNGTYLMKLKRTGSPGFFGFEPDDLSQVHNLPNLAVTQWNSSCSQLGAEFNMAGSISWNSQTIEIRHATEGGLLALGMSSGYLLDLGNCPNVEPGVRKVETGSYNFFTGPGCTGPFSAIKNTWTYEFIVVPA